MMQATEHFEFGDKVIDDEYGEGIVAKIIKEGPGDIIVVTFKNIVGDYTYAESGRRLYADKVTLRKASDQKGEEIKGEIDEYVETQAFPSYDYRWEDYSQVPYVVSHGMSLRDYFAAKALQGLIAAHPDADCGPVGLAREAFLYADKMMKEREK